MASATLTAVALAANGSSTPITPAQIGDCEFVAYGTWGSGTLIVQQLYDSVWFTLASFTANGRVLTTLYHLGTLRVTLSGATSPSLKATVNGVVASSVTAVAST
jgi:hypothetical protein